MGSQILGAQQRPKQVDQQAGGHGAAQDEVEHGASEPAADGDVGGHQCEGTDTKGQEKDVEHGSPLLAEGQQSRHQSAVRYKEAIWNSDRAYKIRIKTMACCRSDQGSLWKF